jgi:dTDP-4-dehydrorhamnose reductase
LNVYGATKLAGERAVAAAGGRHLVFRTSWVYAAQGRNFLRTTLGLARDRDALDVVNDQTGAPTSAAWLAEVTAVAIERSENRSAPPAWGLYHATPRGETTWFDLARFILRVARDHGLLLRVQPEMVRPISSTVHAAAARRPANSRLCTAKLAAALTIDPPAWQDGVVAVVMALVSEMQGARSS